MSDNKLNQVEPVNEPTDTDDLELDSLYEEIEILQEAWRKSNDDMDKIDQALVKVVGVRRKRPLQIKRETLRKSNVDLAETIFQKEGKYKTLAMEKLVKLRLEKFESQMNSKRHVNKNKYLFAAMLLKYLNKCVDQFSQELISVKQLIHTDPVRFREDLLNLFEKVDKRAFIFITGKHTSEELLSWAQLTLDKWTNGPLQELVLPKKDQE